MSNCMHEWYFDKYEHGNYLVFEPDGNRVYCEKCGEEWFHR